MFNCGCTACSESQSMLCPLCGYTGRPVPIDTVKSLAKITVDGKNNFGVCLNPDCNAVYFCPNQVLCQDDVSVSIGWKNGTRPKFICYCNQITEDDISAAVIEKGARSVSDVARITGAMGNGRCKTNNPKGVCCQKDIENVIAHALKQ